MIRRILLAFGLVFSVLGLAVVVSPSVTNLIQLPQVPLLFIGGFAIILGFVIYSARKRVTFRDEDDALIRASCLEGRFEPDRPGAKIDREFGNNSTPAFRGSQNPRLRARLRTLAVRVIVNSEGCSEQDAHHRLDVGTWTDNRTAAALFADDITPPARSLLGDLFGYESLHERKVRHVLDELQEIAGVQREG